MSEWIDLSLDLHPGTPVLPFMPCPVQEPIAELGEEALRVTEVSFATHTGTHFDAARHAIDDGRSIDTYPVDRWVTSGFVQAVDVGAGDLIRPADLDGIEDRLEPGDALIVRTGWEDRIAEASYLEHPYFSAELAEYLVDRGVNWVGMDVITPDKPPEQETADSPFPVHKTLLGNDVLIAENLTNLASLVGERVDLVALPLRLKGLDGSPARVIARPRGAA